MERRGCSKKPLPSMRKAWREQGVFFEKCNKMMMTEAGVDTSASKKWHEVTEKSSCGSSKTKRYSSRTVSTGRCNEANTTWQDRKPFAASFWINRSRPWQHLPRPAERTLQYSRHKITRWDKNFRSVDQQKTCIKRELGRSSVRLRHSQRQSELRSLKWC